MPFPALPCPAMPLHTLPCPALPGPARPCPALPFPVCPARVQDSFIRHLQRTNNQLPLAGVLPVGCGQRYYSGTARALPHCAADCLRVGHVIRSSVNRSHGSRPGRSPHRLIIPATLRHATPDTYSDILFVSERMSSSHEVECAAQRMHHTITRRQAGPGPGRQAASRVALLSQSFITPGSMSKPITLSNVPAKWPYGVQASHC